MSFMLLQQGLCDDHECLWANLSLSPVQLTGWLLLGKQEEDDVLDMRTILSSL